jgi:hypothetical protein
MDDSPNFSQRRGFAPPDAPITVRDEAPGWLRDLVISLAQEAHLGPSDLRDLLCPLLLISPDSNNWSTGNIEREVRDDLWRADWFHVYDFIKILARRIQKTRTREALTEFTNGLNDSFRRKGVGWQLKDGKIETRGEESFETSVRTAIAATQETGRSVANRELHEALADLSKRPAPDVTGAIQHAMAALECVARDVTGDPKSTLGDLLKKHPGTLPPPLDTALSKLWGFASDQARHLRENQPPDIKEAELVVGLAGSLATYLIKKLAPQIS